MNAKPITWTTTHGDVVHIWATERDVQWVDVPIILGGPVPTYLEWRWHVKARNGRILEGGEGHPRRRNAVKAALRHHPRVEPE